MKKGIFVKLTSGVSKQLLSVPVFFKVIGIGFVVATVFTAVILPSARFMMRRILYQSLEDRTEAISFHLAEDLGHLVSIGDQLTIMQKISRHHELYPDMRYIILRNERGEVTNHTFHINVPNDLLNLHSNQTEISNTILLASSEGLICDVTLPLLEGYAGSLQLGMTDQIVRRELGSFTKWLLGAIVVCIIFGTGLALWLTQVLTSPLHHLENVANLIGEGHFEARSKVGSLDEFGRLSIAVNNMAQSLEDYGAEVDRKEKLRVSLIQKIVSTQEEERKIISRELHDQLGQSLTAMLLSIRAKEWQSPELETMTLELIGNVQELAWGLRPPILSDFGLDSALASYVRNISSNSGVEFVYQYNVSPNLGRLPSQIEVELYRVAQEAITNTIRHARATRGSVVVVQRQNEVTLLIEDDGVGFEPELKEGIEHLGLTGMNERISLLDGQFAVESAPGEGTVVRVKISVEGKEDDNSNSNS